MQTINAITDSRRSLRRLLTPAWVFASMWHKLEAVQSRLALPALVLKASVVIVLPWGGPLFASLVAFAWTSLLRPGELLGAGRHRLVLLSDVGTAT